MKPNLLLCGFIPLFFACVVGKAPACLYVNLLSFNPDPSGSSLSDRAFGEAINFLCTRGGGTLFIPEGIYLLSQHYDICGNVRLEGEGKNSLIKVGDKNGKAKSIPFGGLISFKGVANIEVSNLTLDINAPQNYRTLLQFRDCENIVISNCFFENSNIENAHHSWTLHGIEARNTKHFRVVNNQSVGCQFKLCGAIGSATDIEVIGNQFRNCAQMGVSIVAIPQYNNPIKLSNIRIESNTFDQIDESPIYIGFDKGKGLPLSPLIIEDVIIRNNKMNDIGHLSPSGFFGIVIRATESTKNILIEGNEIDMINNGKFSYGIALLYTGVEGSHWSNLIIRSNQIRISDHGGISINNVKNGTIVNNSCKYTGRGIELINSHGIHVEGNKVNLSALGIKVINSSQVTLVKNHLTEDQFGIFIEARVNQKVEVATSSNIIEGGQIRNAIGIFSRGKGVFDENHLNNQIENVSMQYKTQEIPLRSLRVVNGRRIE